jgi:hypothetical protein
LLRSQVYEITFEGRAGSVVSAEFDDCEVSVGQDTTTLRVGLPDPATLWGVLERMMELGLKLIELRSVAVPSAASRDGSAAQGSPAGSRRTGIPRRLLFAGYRTDAPPALLSGAGQRSSWWTAASSAA